MNTRRLVFLVTILAVLAMTSRVSMASDTWWHLATGRYILEHGHIPLEDVFSYTRAGQPWLGAAVGWLMQITLYSIYTNFGFGGLNVWAAMMVTLTFIVLYHSLSGGPFLRAFIIVLAVMTSAVYWAARPYLITFLLAAVTLKILEDFRWQRKDRLWLLPILMLLWVNSHGGWAVGPMLWGLYGLGEGLRWLWQARKPGAILPSQINKEWLISGLRGREGRLLLIGVLMALAVCINPAGLRMLAYPFDTVAIQSLQDYIAEWQTPDFHKLNVQPFLWLLMLTIGAVGTSDKKLDLTEFLLLSAFTYLSLSAARNIALFALVAPIILSHHASPWFDRLGKKLGLSNFDQGPSTRIHEALNWVLVILLLLAVVLKAASVYPQETNWAYLAPNYPEEATAYLQEEQPKGRLFNAYNWGGYLVWQLPQYPVFVDGRTDLYGDEILRQWFQIVRAEPGWQDLLEDWQVSLVLVEAETPLARELAIKGWQQLQTDETSILLQHP